MANTTYMDLDLPEPSVTSGPEWATKVNEALTTVDSHDHTSGNGNRITQAGINVAGDFSLNTNGLTDAQRVAFTSLTALLTSLNILQVKDGDLYFNDSAGNQIRITSGGALDVSSVGGIGGDYATTSASAFYTDALLTYFFQDSAAERALVDMAPKRRVTSYSSAQTLSRAIDDIVLGSGTTTLTLPAAATSTGVSFQVKKTDSSATTLTIDGNASETIDGETSQALTQQYASFTVSCDGTSWYLT